MLKVCQYCFYILNSGNEATAVKWDKDLTIPASPGICKACLKAFDKLIEEGKDPATLVDTTAHERDY